MDVGGVGGLRKRAWAAAAPLASSEDAGVVGPTAAALLVDPVVGRGAPLGAVVAAEWLIGKKGIFTMKDVVFNNNK